jgi:hypothetical protein
VTRIRDSDRSGAWVLLVLLFGITLPAVILRSNLPLRLRAVVAGVVFLFWVALIEGVFF